MRAIGFSTGALAKGDFRRGIELQAGRASALELSALRDHELQPLIDAISTLDLAQFEYVSFHAPGKFTTLTEDDTIEKLAQLPAAWPVVVHPEILITPEKWQLFGSRLCIENMDNRKTTGRTVAEVRALLSLFPEATFCLDVGHARQIDPTMAAALLMLSDFSDRLVQLHVSEVGPAGDHLPVRTLAAMAFRRLAHRVPRNCAVIIESIVPPESIDDELATVSCLFDAEPSRAIA